MLAAAAAAAAARVVVGVGLGAAVVVPVAGRKWPAFLAAESVDSRRSLGHHLPADRCCLMNRLSAMTYLIRLAASAVVLVAAVAAAAAAAASAAKSSGKCHVSPLTHARHVANGRTGDWPDCQATHFGALKVSRLLRGIIQHPSPKSSVLRTTFVRNKDVGCGVSQDADRNVAEEAIMKSGRPRIGTVLHLKVTSQRREKNKQTRWPPRVARLHPHCQLSLAPISSHLETPSLVMGPDVAGHLLGVWFARCCFWGWEVGRTESKEK